MSKQGSLKCFYTSKPPVGCMVMYTVNSAIMSTGIFEYTDWCLYIFKSICHKDLLNESNPELNDSIPIGSEHLGPKVAVSNNEG